MLHTIKCAPRADFQRDGNDLCVVVGDKAPEIVVSASEIVVSASEIATSGVISGATSGEMRSCLQRGRR